MSAMKTENGVEFPAEAYAYVPKPEESSTWKIRLWESPEKKATVEQLGRAAAAFSPGGFRGEKADIPAADLAHVKAAIRAGYAKLDVKPEDMPESVRLSDAPRFLIALDSVVLSDTEQATRVPLAMIGTFYKGKQKFSITRKDVQVMADNFAKRGTGDVVMDYEHASEFPEMAQGQPIPAAAWIVGINPEPDANGVVWGSVKFTDRARKMIAAGEYKYVSPVIDWGTRDRSTGEVQGATLTSAALTNRPVLDRMPAIRLSDAGWTNEKEGGQVAKEKPKCECGENLLCPKCDSDQVKKLAASEHNHGPKVIVLSDIRRTNGQLDFTGLDRAAVISVETLQTIETERVALSEVADAVRAGKITPAQRPDFERIALSDVTAFRNIVKSLPQQVDLTERGLAGTGEEGNDSRATADAKIVASARQIAAERKISFSEAVHLVASEHPELIEARNRALTVTGREGRE